MKGSKKMKKLKKLTIIVTIVLLCLVSFIGIYAKKNNLMQNIVKGYDFGMNIEGYREVRLTVAKDQEVTKDKVETAKQIIEKRLKLLGAQDYLIKVNHVTGEIVLELEETSETDRIIADVYGVGEFKMVDSEDTSKVLITKEDLKQVSLKYGTTETGTTIYLDFEFTEDGAKKIEELSSNQYKTIEKEEKKEDESETTTEGAEENKDTSEETKEEEVKQPKLTLKIDDSNLATSSFDNPITTGRIQLSINEESVNAEEIQESVKYGSAIVTILSNGTLPIKYEVNRNTYVYSEITEEIKIAFVIGIAVLVTIALIALIIKYKVPAILASISYIGFIALYLLVLRYANVVISLEGVVGILIMLIINYLSIQKLLAKSSIMETIKEMGIQLIPVIAVIIAFSFIGWTNISSFGMTMFWGLLLTIIYHVTVTKVLIEK